MKSELFEYYPPTEDELKALWKDGVLILDTNVLLSLYRLPDSSREEFLKVLEGLKDRIWVPYHVTLEYQRSRLNVIHNERKITEDVLADSVQLFEAIQKKVLSRELDRRGLGIDADGLLKDLKKSSDQLVEAMESAHKSQLDVATSDPIRDRLDALLEKKVGPGPSSQVELDALCANGDQRYDLRIPPGYLDSDKDKNPSEANFHHNGLSYVRKFGDLILWRQIVEHAKSAKLKRAIFVTSDAKDDWWWREKGKTIGPRPELRKEIRSIAGVETFWMYTSEKFLENAKTFAEATVSEEAVSDVQYVTRDVARYVFNPAIATGRNKETSSFRLQAQVQVAVFNWLAHRYEDVEINMGFPDFLVNGEGGMQGFDVKVLRTPNSIALPNVQNSLLQGYGEVNEGRLSRFTLILVMSIEREDESFWLDQRSGMKRRLERQLRRYPVDEVIVGMLVEGGFVEIMRVDGSNLEE